MKSLAANWKWQQHCRYSPNFNSEFLHFNTPCRYSWRYGLYLRKEYAAKNTVFARVRRMTDSVQSGWCSVKLTVRWPLCAVIQALVALQWKSWLLKLIWAIVPCNTSTTHNVCGKFYTWHETKRVDFVHSCCQDTK